MRIPWYILSSIFLSAVVGYFLSPWYNGIGIYFTILISFILCWTGFELDNGWRYREV